ncbi:MAG: amino acid-binding protein [Phycisphaerae bacterium]|jgi:predicted amino acid-binding ACT domain protein
MSYEISQVDIWAGTIEDRSGGAARVLKCLSQAGADLEFVIGRPTPDEPGKGILYVSPLTSDGQRRAAEAAGLRRSGIHVLRVTGPDRPGLVADTTLALAEQGVNLGGLTSAVLAGQVVLYLRFNTRHAMQRGREILERHLYE